jgi:cysteine desulfurase
MHYLDYAATTPVSPEVAREMLAVLTEEFGNPSAQYELGRAARIRLDRDRETVAGALGCRPEQLFFTSCGTEGDNWAIRAALHQNRRVGRHIVTTAVEHSAVLQCVKALEQEGYAVSYLKPDSTGHITAEQVSAALREDTALVSVMLVNNETGARLPVEEIAALLADRPALLHTDAVQGFLKVPFTAGSLGADYITLSAHKIGGPKGIGALYIGGRAKNTLPLLYGGGQEAGLRPGTEATAQIAGFAKAAALRRQCLEETWRHLADCRAYAVERLGEIPDLCFVGQGDAPHILSVSLPGYPSQNIVSELSGKGICISAGSACHRGRVSHVLSAMGLDKKTAAGTVRVSFGPETTREDIDQLASALLEHRRTRFPML